MLQPVCQLRSTFAPFTKNSLSAGQDLDYTLEEDNLWHQALYSKGKKSIYKDLAFSVLQSLNKIQKTESIFFGNIDPAVQKTKSLDIEDAILAFQKGIRLQGFLLHVSNSAPLVATDLPWRCPRLLAKINTKTWLCYSYIGAGKDNAGQ